MEKLHIMTIGLNRPDKRNAVNDQTGERLKEAFQDFESDENMYCAVLHGLGGNFCAGYDLEELSELEEDLANKMAEILMEKLNVPAMFIANKSVMSLYGGGNMTGISVDSGHDTTYLGDKE